MTRVLKRGGGGTGGMLPSRADGPVEYDRQLVGATRADVVPYDLNVTTTRLVGLERTPVRICTRTTQASSEPSYSMTALRCWQLTTLFLSKLGRDLR